MTRTIISLPKELKTWLYNYSKKNKRSIAETIREAIIIYKEKNENEDKESLLEQTSGLWKKKNIDALSYVNSIRGEWGESEK